MWKKEFNKNQGFTLIELLVSISIFTLILTMMAGSIFTVLDSNRKSQSLRSVMDNLNHTLESMTRTIRFGTNYHCDITQGSADTPRDCTEGASSLAVRDSSGVINYFKLDNGSISRSRDSGNNYYNLTGSDVTISTTTFYVIGSESYSDGDLYQPKVIVVISGYAGSKSTSRSTFTLETTISQRIFDSQ